MKPTKLPLLFAATILLVGCEKEQTQTPITLEKPKVTAPIVKVEEAKPVVVAPVEVTKPKFNPMGKTEQELIASLGQPISRLEVGDITLMYPDFSYVLSDGVVTEIKAGTKSWEVTATTPAPQPVEVASNQQRSPTPHIDVKENQIKNLQTNLENFKAQHAGKRFFNQAKQWEYDAKVEKLEKEIRDLKNS